MQSYSVVQSCSWFRHSDKQSHLYKIVIYFYSCVGKKMCVQSFLCIFLVLWYYSVRSCIVLQLYSHEVEQSYSLLVFYVYLWKLIVLQYYCMQSKVPAILWLCSQTVVQNSCIVIKLSSRIVLCSYSCAVFYLSSLTAL